MNKSPRFMIAAPSSGSGKTMLTCGLMRLLQKKGYEVQGFKCGPDYIDPMFHTRVLGIPSVNLDSFFAEDEVLRYLFDRRMQQRYSEMSIAVLEGVMGYYDGLAGRSIKGSTCDIAKITDTPVILCIDTKGMSLSVVPYVKGFLEYIPDSHIQGVILNRCSKGMYPILKELLETQLNIAVIGYMPVLEDCELPSRHLGLYLPQEIQDFQQKVERIADTLADTLDMECLLGLAKSAPALETKAPDNWSGILQQTEPVIRIAIAWDNAFCFYYQDNLDILESLGVELVPFSPIVDSKLPENICGLLLGGGYPENYARELSCNASMRQSVARAIQENMPCLAECGGFLYLHDAITDIDGEEWAMVSAVHATAAYQGKLQPRFGYITLEDGQTGMQIRGHEFHYYDSTDYGQEWTARKPLSSRHWSCMHKQGNLLTGFPHLYYASDPGFAAEWVQRCRQWRKE